MHVEFIGGPLDGDTAEIDPTLREFRYPLRTTMDVWKGDDPLDVAMSRLRVGIYAPKGNPRLFHWRGER